MASLRTIIVTGANRGIGRAICQTLLSDKTIGPVHLVATSRNGDDFGLTRAHKDHEVSYAKLDIASSDSIHNFVESFKKQHDRLDVLINNAGININAEDTAASVTKTLNVNYRGTLQMCQAFLHHLTTTRTHTSRIVNLSSVASSLRAYSPEVASRFRSIASQGTLEDLEQLAQDYDASSPSSAFAEPPRRSYSVSKALVNGLTAILARENPSVLINACCPGWIDTDMGGIVSPRGTRPPKTAEEGAQVVLHLAVGEIGDVSGKYWANDSIRAKGLPGVREW